MLLWRLLYQHDGGIVRVFQCGLLLEFDAFVGCILELLLRLIKESVDMFPPAFHSVACMHGVLMLRDHADLRKCTGVS